MLANHVKLGTEWTRILDTFDLNKVFLASYSRYPIALNKLQCINESWETHPIMAAKCRVNFCRVIRLQVFSRVISNIGQSFAGLSTIQECRISSNAKEFLKNLNFMMQCLLKAAVLYK